MNNTPIPERPGDAEEQRLRAEVERLRLPELFPHRVHGMRGLREPRADEAGLAADTLELPGVFLLGSPSVGTREFVASKLYSTISSAREYVTRAQQQVLLPGGAAGGQDFPEEYLALMRLTLPGRFQHHCRAVTHPVLEEKARKFKALQKANLARFVNMTNTSR
ncbi:MAG: hypothetical protein SGPRY_012559 [Prymnesium sp.]